MFHNEHGLIRHMIKLESPSDWDTLLSAIAAIKALDLVDNVKICDEKCTAIEIEYNASFDCYCFIIMLLSEQDISVEIQCHKNITRYFLR